MLNTLQLKAYNEVLHGSSQIVTLVGSAGTGKSYTTAQIAKNYPGVVVLTATTNKAKELLANMSGIQAKTIHSVLGFNMVRNGKEEYLADCREANLPINSNILVIVEEISMLPRVVYNKLREELSKNLITKILLLGDPIQLPAVGLGIRISDIPGVHIELTEQMRQVNNPTLSDTFNLLRKAIKYNERFTFENPPDSLFITTNHKEFATRYKEAVGTTKLISYSNSCVNRYNTAIHHNSLSIGDDLILNKPLGEATNGSTITIHDIIEQDKYYEIDTIVGGEYLTIRQYKTKKGYREDLEAAPDYWAFVDQCYDLKHQYACTTFKAQGSTYDHVFLDFSDLLAHHSKRPTRFNNYTHPISYNTMLRHLYVALSRMRLSATVYIGTKRNYNYFKQKDHND